MKQGKISSKYIIANNNRFEGKYYLNTNSYLSMILEQAPIEKKPLENYATAFNPPVFKRQFCKKTNRSVQYFQSSDVPSAIETSDVFVFRPQAESLNLLVKKGDILVTGFGTIGNIKVVTSLQDDTCFANNVCRIRPNKKEQTGLIYSLLASKYGYAQLNKNASGSVVRYIEAPGIKKTLVPNFPDSFQKEVDDLIQQSATLREQAAAKLDEAKRIVDDYCDNAFKKTDGFKYQAVKSTKINSSYKTRIDAPFFINDGVEWTLSSTKKTVRLGDLDITSWYPGIFKRIYVQNGYPYIKGSSLFETNPFRRCDQLSKSRTPMLDQLGLKEGMLMMSCAGICGQVKMITKEYEEKGAIGSPDIIRLISNDSLITTEYLFVYFQLPAVYDFLQSLKYGSVIERFDIGNIENTPIVEPSKELSAKTTELVKQYMDCTYRAFCAEEKAITMVEEEIEKWQSPTA
ncbi:MAG: restriction endonuclease subunit S [Bacteroidales bacterium]|nr:restriction endonuclease subunit S [Bacteroidales bacterium]